MSVCVIAGGIKQGAISLDRGNVTQMCVDSSEHASSCVVIKAAVRVTQGLLVVAKALPSTNVNLRFPKFVARMD